jgi:hypothetical protein
MKIWMKKIFFLAASGVVYLVGEYLRGVWFENLPINPCQYSIDQQGIFCNSPYVDIGFAFMAAGQVFAIIGIILLFANEKGFRAWWRFSRWYVPIVAFIVIFLSPIVLFHSLMLSSSISRERVVYDFGAIYILVTLFIIIWKWVIYRLYEKRI